MSKQTQNIIAIVGIIIFGYLAFTYMGENPGKGNDRIMSPEEVSLPVGETMQVLGLSITLGEVTNDYRCPVDVQCIEAGAINTKIILSDGVDTFETFYSSDGVPMNFNGYNISIVGASPDLYVGKSINQDDYVVTFHVESALSGVVDNPYYSGGAGGTVPSGENPCSAMGGVWDGVNLECLGIGANTCQEIGGTFNECASACRNDPKAEVCTMQCVQVCEFK